MSLQLKVCHDVWGTWSVHGLSPTPVSHLSSLSACIDYARKACDAVPATIELFVDGTYIVVHQQRGWLRPLFAAEPYGPRSAAPGPDLCGPPMRSRFRAWLTGLLSFSPERNHAAPREESASRAAG